MQQKSKMKVQNLIDDLICNMKFYVPVVGFFDVFWFLNNSDDLKEMINRLIRLW